MPPTNMSTRTKGGVSFGPFAVTHELGMQAGRIRARRYHRERAAVSLADCVAAAAALASESALATSDPALAEVLRSEGGKVHPLPDSKGRRP